MIPMSSLTFSTESRTGFPKVGATQPPLPHSQAPIQSTQSNQPPLAATIRKAKAMDNVDDVIDDDALTLETVKVHCRF